jgi:hypothetical protein
MLFVARLPELALTILWEVGFFCVAYLEDTPRHHRFVDILTICFDHFSHLPW